MEQSQPFKSRFGDQLVIGGVVFGNLAWVLDLVYTSHSYWGSPALKGLSIAMMVVQPLFYVVKMHREVSKHKFQDKRTTRGELMSLCLPYAFLQHFRLLGGFRSFNEVIQEKFSNEDDFQFVSLENCFKLQTHAELWLQFVPQVILQIANNQSTVVMEDIKLKIVQYPSEAFNAQTLLANSTLYDDLIYIKTFQVGWGFLGTLVVVLNILLIIKNLYLILAYVSERGKEGSVFRP